MPNLLPRPRGPISDAVIRALRTGSQSSLPEAPPVSDDPLTGEDTHLALHCCYELFHDGFTGVDDRWEWEPALLGLRRSLEERFLGALRAEQRPAALPTPRDIPAALRELIGNCFSGPSTSRYLAEEGSLDNLRELVIHRSIYQRKEADAHTFGIPRLRGGAKSAMVRIQAEEYGDGRPGHSHAELFATTMACLDLDPTPGAYIDVVPGVTLATDNLVSMFGLHRALRGALVGHLAAFEMTSVAPMARYASAVRRLSGDAVAAEFYAIHVEADAGHEVIASKALAGGFARDEPGLIADVLFGASALMQVERRLGAHLLTSWRAGRASLLHAGLPERVGAGAGV